MEAKRNKWEPKKSKYDVELSPWEEEAVKGLYAGKPLLGEGGVFTAMVKRIVQARLKGEMQAHLAAEDQAGNRCNGNTHKTLKTSGGPVEIATPRDREGTFEPHLVGKRVWVLNDELDAKIPSMYGLGLSYAGCWASVWPGSYVCYMLHPIRLVSFALLLNCAPKTSAQFGPQNLIDFSGVYGVSSMALGDVDGDGDTDVVYAGAGWSIRWFPNRGDGTFMPQQVVQNFAGSSSSVSLVDLDGDGDLDILALHSGSFGWFPNLGGGIFGAEQILNSSFAPGSIAAMDSDLDGLLDLFVTCATCNGVYYFLGLGNATFQAPILLTTAVPNARSVALGDMDNDGNPDIVVGGLGTPSLFWLRNLGSGFGPAQVVNQTMVGGELITLGDLDGDGYLDVIASVPNGSNIMAMLNLGDGTFGTAVSALYAVQPRDVALADVNGDGHPDIMGTGTGRVIGAIGNGDGTFGEQITLHFTTGGDVGAADMNGDGQPDLVACIPTDKDILLYANNGAGGFLPAVPIGTSANTYGSVEAKDLDGDGDLDVLVAVGSKNMVQWFRNDGDGNFDTGHVITTEAYGATHATAADLDGDGDLDVISASNVNEGSHRTAWYENDGTGQFGPIQIIAADGNGSYIVEAADLDGDDDLDILGGNAAGQLVYFRNDGGGVFTEVAIGTSASKSIGVADVDGDGDLDIVSGSSALNVFLNNGDGSFTNVISTSYSSQNGASFVAFKDMDLDGSLDVLFMVNGGVRYHPNLGGGDFGAMVYHGVLNNGTPDVCLGDIDLDGRTDLLCGAGGTAGNPGTKTVWGRHRLSQPFAPSEIIWEDYYSSGVVLHLADLDGDGDLDALLGEPFYGRLAWYENYTLNPFWIEGEVFVDMDGNGTWDLGEPPAPFIPVSVVSATGASVFTGADGAFRAPVEPGQYGITAMPSDELWSVSTVPDPIELDVSEVSPIPADILVGLAAVDTSDVVPTLNLVPAVCSDTAVLWLGYRNQGSRMEAGTITLHLDTAYEFLSSTDPPLMVDGPVITWAYTDLAPFVMAAIPVRVRMPSASILPYTYRHRLEITTTDAASDPRIDSLVALLQCSFDPNDKAVIPSGYGEYGAIDQGTRSIDYVIRFQNTGTAPAQDVVLRDELSNVLDREVVPLAWSHAPTSMVVNELGELIIRFNDIMLPDSTSAPQESQGFVRFRARPVSTPPAHMTQAYNTAGIHFDLNDAVITNTTRTTWVDCGIFHPGITELNADTLTTFVQGEHQWWFNGEPIPYTDQYLPLQGPGTYMAVVTSQLGCVASTPEYIILPTFVQGAAALSGAAVYPNPFRERIVVQLPEEAAPGKMKLMDLSGRVVQYATGNVVQLDTQHLAPGMYMLHISLGDAPFAVVPVVRE